jgi:hypothetical protein
MLLRQAVTKIPEIQLAVILRERDFFECCRKVPLITNELSARKWPKIQKNHRL